MKVIEKYFFYKNLLDDSLNQFHIMSDKETTNSEQSREGPGNVGISRSDMNVGSAE